MTLTKSLREKCRNTEYFLVRIFLYSVQIQENTDQKILRIWTLSRSECESKSRFRDKSVSIFWLFFREFYTTTFLCKSVDWFLYDRDLRHKRINKAMSLIIVTAIFIERLSSTNFTWYILEYFVPYDTLLNKPIEICSSSRWFIFHLAV